MDSDADRVGNGVVDGMNSTSMQLSFIVRPGFTTLSCTLPTRLCSLSLPSTSPSVRLVP